jgi:hypothetical protein
LYVHNLSIVDLAGLSSETILAGTVAGDALGTLGKAAFDALVAADSAFRKKLITAKGSTITKQIHDLDRQRDTDQQEIWRMANAAAKSSNATKAQAGQTLIVFMKPYHDAPREALMSETSTLQYMHVQYDGNQALQDAATALQLDTVFASLFTANEQLNDLWNERADEDADKSGPSPSSLRSDLEKSYGAFCDVVIQHLRLKPSEPLEHLFSVMNEIRIKYHHSLPVRLTDVNTSVEAIPVQPYTGEGVTPVPRVFLTASNGTTSELRFTVDYYVTYRNNVSVGEAKILIHGKGHYTGLYISTFHIER